MTVKQCNDKLVVIVIAHVDCKTVPLKHSLGYSLLLGVALPYASSIPGCKDGRT